MQHIYHESESVDTVINSLVDTFANNRYERVGIIASYDSYCRIENLPLFRAVATDVVRLNAYHNSRDFADGYTMLLRRLQPNSLLVIDSLRDFFSIGSSYSPKSLQVAINILRDHSHDCQFIFNGSYAYVSQMQNLLPIVYSN